MSATTAGALKALIESMGLGVQAFRDGIPVEREVMPDGTVREWILDSRYPCVVIQEGIDYGSVPDGDEGDPDAEVTVDELVQLDVYQLARRLVPGGSESTEDYALHDTIRARLRGAQLPLIRGQRVYAVRLQGGRRWPIADNVTRHTIDVLIRRTLNRSATP